MSQELSEEVWAHYKTNGTDLTKIPSLVEQRTFMQNLNTARSSNVPKGIDDKENNWNFEGRVTAE